MNKQIKTKLINIAKRNFPKCNSSHELDHAMRVLKTAEYIGRKEKGDLEVIIPAALFHDIIWYPKGHPKTNYAPYESAGYAVKILSDLNEYPKHKISKVYTSIKQCSLTKKGTPSLLEGKILQDADRLDTVGAMSIMKSLDSSNQTATKIYSFNSSIPKHQEVNNLEFDLDIFYTSVLKLKDIMHTSTARTLAEKRTKLLEKYLLIGDKYSTL